MVSLIERHKNRRPSHVKTSFISKHHKKCILLLKTNKTKEANNTINKIEHNAKLTRMSHKSKPILLGECSTRKETQRPSLARSLAAGHKWRACSQANTHALVKPCKYNQDISQQYGTNICNQCKRSTCRS